MAYKKGDLDWRINKGEVITAKFLNNMAENVRILADEGIKPPHQLNQPADGDQQNQDEDAEPVEAFIESRRDTSSVTVYDQNEENYATIQRIDRVEFTNGLGETLILVFTN